MRTSTARFALVAGSLFGLSGCYPAVHKYYRATVPGAEYRTDNCVGYSSAYYEYHGIFISLSFGDSRYLQLRVYVPHGIVVQINDRVVLVHGDAKGEETVLTLTLRPAWAGQEECRRCTDRRMSSDEFGPLAGSDDPKMLFRYHFGLEAPAPAGLSGGTLDLPSLTINGQRYESQRVSFTEKTYVGLLPVNC